jgi:hypothetical protein
MDGWVRLRQHALCLHGTDAPGSWPATLPEGGDQFRAGSVEPPHSRGHEGQGTLQSGLVPRWTWTARARPCTILQRVYPDEIIPQYARTWWRLWAASADYQLDMRCSDAIFKQLLRQISEDPQHRPYISGNLDGFDPTIPYLLPENDGPGQVGHESAGGPCGKCLNSYERYEFHTVPTPFTISVSWTCPIFSGRHQGPPLL